MNLDPRKGHFGITMPVDKQAKKGAVILVEILTLIIIGVKEGYVCNPRDSLECHFWAS